MPLTFTEYQSLDLVKNTNTVLKKMKDNANDEWVAMEKIHGSNFSFICDGVQVACGRRNALLAENESFYSYQIVRDKYRDAVLKLHASLAPHVESTDYVSVVYGELFGGIYPHPDVEDLGFLHVQKGVYYCPGIEFSAFDVCVNIPQSNKQQWMNYDLCQQLFENSGLWYSKPVIRGTLAEVLQYDIKRNSTIPKLLGLPELEQNQMEGIVIKSVEPIYYGRHQLRAIYKMKNIKFQEVNPKPPPTKYERNRDARSEAIVKIYEELARYVMNDNRADGISSKIGRITESNVTEAAEALFNDALKDFLKDSSDLWNSVDTDVQETVQKNMKSAAVTFVNEYILKQ